MPRLLTASLVLAVLALAPACGGGARSVASQARNDARTNASKIRRLEERIEKLEKAVAEQSK